MAARPNTANSRRADLAIPAGRKPKSRNFQTLLHRELEEKVTPKEGDRIHRLTKREAIVKSLVNGALRQDPRSTHLLMSLLRDAPLPEPLGTSPEEAEDLQRALQMLVGPPKKRKGENR